MIKKLALGTSIGAVVLSSYAFVAFASDYTFSSGAFSLSPDSISLFAGETKNVSIKGSGNFVALSNPNPNVAAVSVSGNSITVTGIQYGSTNVAICESASAQCNNLFIMVNTPSNGEVLGLNLYADGTLISDNGTIYITYKSTKTGFATWAAFTGLGYKYKNVISASTTTLSDSGKVIGSASVAHPAGSWVIRSGTIYFVDSYGLIPIPSYEIFLNNGGMLSKVVPANNADMQLTVGSLMVLADTRLK